MYAGICRQAVGADQAAEAEQFVTGADVLRKALLRQFVDFVFKAGIATLVDFCAAFVVGRDEAVAVFNRARPGGSAVSHGHAQRGAGHRHCASLLRNVRWGAGLCVMGFI